MDGDFSFDERLGIYFSVQSACLSGAAVTLLLGYALVRWLKRVRILRRDSTRFQTEVTDSSLFLNLMLADLLQAIGNMPSIRWMRAGRITEGTLCTAQGVIKQIGINGVALTSLAIAIHTFSVLILRWRAPRHISKYMVVGVWVFTALVVGIPNAVRRNEVYYGDTGYWCWIVTRYKTEQIMSEYLWVWMAAFLMAILYTIMFLVMRGFILIEKGIHWQSSKQRVKLDLDDTDDEEEKEMRTIANLLLFYPAIYIVCVFPNSLSRWLFFSGKTVPYQFTLFASALFAFSGLFNVILFFITRPELVKGPSPTTPTAASPTIPHAHTKYGHLPSPEGNPKVEIIESEKVDRTSPTANAYGNRVMLESPLTAGGWAKPLYQSPPAALKTLPLPNSGSRSASGHSAAGYSASARPRTGGSTSQQDDDDDDYGRLPG